MRKPAKALPISEWANLSDAIFWHAKARPDAVALVEGDDRITYKEFAQLVGKAAVDLRKAGIKPGEVVAVVMATNIDHIILSFALIRVGAVPLDMPPNRAAIGPVNPFTRFKIERVFVGTGVAKPKNVKVTEIEPKWRERIGALKGDHRYAGNPDEVFYLSVTSGSTGLPKGVVTTHRQWLARYESAVQLLPRMIDAEKPPCMLVIGGMGFSAFFFFLANQIFIGGTVVVMAENHDPAFLIAEINKWDDSATLITPPLCRQILSKAKPGEIVFPKMRSLCIGAAPLYAEEKENVQQKLTHNFYEVYGSAACGFISALSPDDVATKAESVGRLAPGIETEVVDADGKPVPDGQVGHLRCKGPGVSKGFLNTDEKTARGAEGFNDGWYYPGDLAALSEGMIYLKGRVNDVILRNGKEIFPSEIEEIFLGHASVADVAAVAGPTNEKGQQLIVFVVPHGEPATRELADHCRAKIPKEKFPDKVYYTRGLPKNPNGKVDRVRLKAAAERGPDAAKVAEGAA